MKFTRQNGRILEVEFETNERRARRRWVTVCIIYDDKGVPVATGVGITHPDDAADWVKGEKESLGDALAHFDRPTRVRAWEAWKQKVGVKSDGANAA